MARKGRKSKEEKAAEAEAKAAAKAEKEAAKAAKAKAEAEAKAKADAKAIDSVKEDNAQATPEAVKAQVEQPADVPYKVDEDGIIVIDEAVVVDHGDLGTPSAFSFTHVETGKRLQGGGAPRGPYHYIAKARDDTVENKKAWIDSMRHLGYNRVPGNQVRCEGFPGAIIMRCSDANYERLRKIKAAEANRSLVEFGGEHDQPGLPTDTNVMKAERKLR